MAVGRPQATSVRVRKPHRRTALGSGSGNWPVCSAQLIVVQANFCLFRDEKWVKNWFARQRSKLAARNRKDQPATTYSATVPTFKLQLSVRVPRRSASTPNRSRRQPSPATLEPPSSRPPRLTVDTDAISRSHRSVSAPVHSKNQPMNTVLSSHAPTYSRDPLCNRYPDFSQFFRPQAHQRPHTLELSTPIDGHTRLMQPPANANTAVHPMYFLGLSNPFSLAALSPRPVAFSMRLVDLLSHH